MAVNAMYHFTSKDTQAVKGIAILLMIWHHLFGFPESHSYESLWPINLAFYFGHFGKVCVAIYLFLSGYGLTASALNKQCLSLRDAFTRLRRFYFNYWLYLAILAPYGIFVLGEGRFRPDTYIFLLNLSGFGGLGKSYVVAWWFVGLYATLLLVFPLVFRMSTSKPLAVPLLALALMGLQTKLSEHEWLQTLTFWQLPFMIGVCFARLNIYSTRVATLVSRQTIYWHSAMLMALFLFRFGAGVGCQIDFIIAPFFVLSAARVVDQLGVSTPLVFLGRLSLPLWLSHCFIYTYAERFIYSPRYPLLIFTLLLFINIPAVWLIEKFYHWADAVVIWPRNRSATAT